eukprot:1143625-Pelagomonas_calceolata.AAC.2
MQKLTLARAAAALDRCRDSPPAPHGKPAWPAHDGTGRGGKGRKGKDMIASREGKDREGNGRGKNEGKGMDHIPAPA